LGKKDIGTIYSLFSILLLFPGHDAVNPVSWTLSYELYFYLIFSLVILDRRLLIFPILILIISFINLFTHTFGSSLLDKHPLYFYFSPFNFEFLAGVLVSLFGQKFTLNKTVIYASFLGIIVYMFLFGTTILDDVNQQRVGVFLIPSLLLVFCITNLETNFNFKFSETLIKLGNASYALYLIHFPIIILVTKITKHLSINNLSVWILFLVLFITIPFSAFLLHEKIEKKVIKALK
jgi:peptidoglycan/LPS O-acetylase OafA/YrhL